MRSFHFQRSMNRLIALAMGVLGTLAAGLIPNDLPAQSQAQSQDIDILSGIRIPMRDGITLNATVYKPHDQKGPIPVAFTLTPYISDSYHARGSYFAHHGYVYAIIDVRGRGSSEGQFDPFFQEARDGHDIVEWLARQPWSNGKITMWGGSYAGYDQWATAKELPPHLSTIVPVAAAKPGVDFPMEYNINAPYTIQWLTFTSGKTGNENLFDDGGFWASKFKERYLKDLPFTSLDSLAGNPNPIFQKWTSHPAVDDYIRSAVPTPQQYAGMNFPILTITGCYDADQPGALNFYQEFMKYAQPAGKDKHYLIIGPWDHPGTRTPKKQVGGLVFGDASLLDMNDLHRQWYDYAMKDSARPAFLKNKVAYFVTNRDQWKYVASLDEIGRNKLKFYLCSEKEGRNDVVHSGALQTGLPQDNAPGQYIYDPLDKRFAALDSAKEQSSASMLDQTDAFTLGNEGLIYHTEPFSKDQEVSGFFGLDAFIAADVPDLDISVGVYEIRPDGSSIPLTGNTIRARYRESLEKEELLTPNATNLYHFRGFTFISRVIGKGSRLRLLITSPNSIYVQQNYCSGGVVARETGKDARTAHIKVYGDARHPSVLLVPVMD